MNEKKEYDFKGISKYLIRINKCNNIIMLFIKKLYLFRNLPIDFPILKQNWGTIIIYLNKIIVKTNEL